MVCLPGCGVLGCVLCRPKLVLLTLLVGSLLLLKLSFDYRNNYLSDYFFYYPSHCRGDAGSAAFELINKLHALGYTGFQLSYSSPSGRTFDCAAGWRRREFPFQSVSLSSRFRYASVSKVFTSMVTMELIQKGVISESDKLVKILGLQGAFLDARIKKITLGDLLRHRAGFARGEYDPMFAADPWCPRNPSRLQALRLNYAPGQKYAYSNLGYCLLGSALAKVAHKSERDLISAWLHFSLASAHSIDMVEQGQYLEGEVKIYPGAGEHIDPIRDINYSSLVSVGGWLGSATDLRGVGEVIYRGYLSGRAVDEKVWRDSDCELGVIYSCHGKVFYSYRENSKKLMFFRDGSLPGVTSFLGAFDDGSTIVFLANSRLLKNRPNERVIKALYEFVN